MQRRRAWGLPASLLLGACVLIAEGSPAASQPAGISQVEAKKLILAQKRRLFRDADSIRDARLSQPYVCPAKNGDCICVEANAKNAYGGFTGIQLIGFRIRDRKDIEGLGEMGVYAREGVCGKTLTPFPELNARR